MKKKTLYWILQTAGWSLYGFINVLAFYFSGGHLKILDFIGVIYQALFYVLSTHGYRWFIKKRGWTTYSNLRLIPMILLSNLLLGAINYILLLFFTFLSGSLVPNVEFKAVNITLGILGPASMYLLWSLVYLSFHYFEQYNKSLKYESVIRDTELNHLRSQLNPHFIFNALNSIKALVDEDPAKSKLAITQLSGIIRNSLQIDKLKLVSLEEEIKTVKDYLGLESIRFEERLDIDYQIGLDTYYFNVPPMMIQTLVENGIKHGISQLKEGGKIQIKTFLENDSLNIQIRNSGVYLEKKSEEERVGLENTKKRLELLYGHQAQFKILNESKNLVLTQIIIPRKDINESNNHR